MILFSRKQMIVNRTNRVLSKHEVNKRKTSLMQMPIQQCRVIWLEFEA